MRTATTLLALAAAFLSICGTDGIAYPNWMNFGFRSSSANAKFNSVDKSTAEVVELKPFQQKDTEYSFIYNVQIASGFQSAEQSAATQQNAVTRIQCIGNIHFASERHAQLRLEQCRMGQQNGQMSQPQDMQPMELFEEANIAEQTAQQLLSPCQFSFVDGVVERVQCPQDAEEWSKNFKKAVLNLVQMNLKQIDVQGLQKSDTFGGAEQFQQPQKGAAAWHGKSFKIPEITVEGVCQTIYTINNAQNFGKQQIHQYNVTKTINFKKCQKIADVAYGYQADQPQPQCAQCQQAQQQSDQKSASDQPTSNEWQMGGNDQHPCAKCDPKEVKENELDRSTVIRCRIAGDPAEQYALDGCELRSQYVYRKWKSAEDDTSSGVMQTVVVANLEAVEAKPKQQQIPAISSPSEHDTLMYSNGKAVDEKRFFANGDNEFGTDGKGSPFGQVPKVQQAKQALLKLEQYVEDNHKGIDQQAPVQQQRLVEMLRMCTEKELEQVKEHCTSAAQHQRQKRGEKCHRTMANALAQCGTRNCVAELARKIKSKQVAESVAVQALLALNQLPSPSDAIVDEMQRLCQSETVAGNQVLKQSCWLAFGALVNELCQPTTAQNAAECAGDGDAKCAQSVFVDKGKCPADKKQQYKETLLALYKQSPGCIYDKAVALGALGNAGLAIALADLERIIKDTREARVIRMMAIDATRRMRAQMPNSVRDVLLPVFLNTREQPQVRITAFANIFGAQPTAEVVDQLMYAIGNEPNREVQAYCYTTMKTVANSQKPGEAQIANHVKSALKLMAHAEHQQQLRTSGKWQFDQLYNSAQREGIFLSVVHAISSRSALPAYAHVQLDTQFNDRYLHNSLNIFMVQQEAERWYERTLKSFSTTATKRKQQQKHQQKHKHNSKQLRTIFEQLGIKAQSHRSDFGTVPTADDDDGDTYQQQRNDNNMRPFVMFGLRSNNVDKAFIALDEHTIGQQMRRALNGEEKHPNWAAILLGQQQQLAMAMVQQNLDERGAKIATSAGVPLHILSTMPMMANIEGRMRAKQATEKDMEAVDMAPSDRELGVHFEFNTMSARMAHIQKMELITPFAVAGVEGIRSVQLNLPLMGVINSDWQEEGISIRMKLPHRGTQLASAHSLPFTFVAKAEPSAQLVREPRQIIAAAHDPKLEQQQREVNAVLGQTEMALPLHIRGHYHVPAVPTNLLQLAQLLMATENAIHVQFQPNEESPRELILRASGEHFRKAAQFEQPDAQLSNFFVQPFQSAYGSCSSALCEQPNGGDNECDSDEAAAYCDEAQLWQQGTDAREAESNEQFQQQQQQLDSFISTYKPSQQYQHALRLSAQTKGGARDTATHCAIRAQCDERMRYCTLQAEANMNEQWTLNAQAHAVMPDAVPTVEQLQQPQLFKQFIGHAKAQWGSNQQPKQQMNVRIYGTQAHTEQTRTALMLPQQGKPRMLNTQQQQKQRKLVQRSAFLNQFHVEAMYTLKPYAQNMVNRGLELLKSAYFWNTKSQLLSGPNAAKDGKIAATISIDPLKPSNANVTIRTPAQQLRMQQIQMPSAVRPFPLIRPQSAQQTHSLAQLFFQQFGLKSRAQCIVDGRNVVTFDGFAFTAPLSSNCYSVLAKDCSPMEEQQPQFVVMMKKVAGKQNAKKPTQKADKVLKVITAEQQIECQPKKAHGKKGQLICKVNGQPMSSADGEQCQDELQRGQCVQFNDPQQKTDVTIRTGPIAVRFDGRKAWLKVSQAYKNAQCGLCGHYDDADEQADELRMANGQIASNLAQFHRSYALKDTEQCTQQAMNSFYDENKGDEPQEEEKDTFYRQYNQRKQPNENEKEAEDEETEQYNNGNDEEEKQWDNEQFDGQIEDNDDENYGDEQEEEGTQPMNVEEETQSECCCCCAKEQSEAQRQKCQRKCQKGGDKCRRKCDQCQQQQKMKQKHRQNSAWDGQWKAVSPTLSIQMYEQNHALCFSTEPIKQCPRGTTAYGGAENDADEQQGEKKPKRRVRFVCMDRAESEARQLMRQLRRGQRPAAVQLNESRGDSFTEVVDEPQQCWRRRN